MIIVEGPDGAGKTTLIRKLSMELDLPIHERSANSDGTATMDKESTRDGNLTLWAFQDVQTIPDQPMSIYDRHCLISEYIYGPIMRGYLGANFLSPVMHLSIRQLAEYSLVVFCRPPEDEIGRNLCGDDNASFQMEGVRGRWRELMCGYDAMRMFWPGNCITYDYTKPHDYANVATAARIHIGRFNQMKGNR